MISFTAQHHISHLRSPQKLRPYGQTKKMPAHPRKPFPASPPSPYGLQAARRAQMQNENAAPPPTTPRRRRTGPGYPSASEFKNFRYLAAPPSKYPRLVGDQIYIDIDDAAQPIVEEIKAKGPLTEQAQRVLQQLSEYRFQALTRASYHKEAVIVEEAMANTEENVRRIEQHDADAARLRALHPVDMRVLMWESVQRRAARRKLKEERQREQKRLERAERKRKEEEAAHAVEMRLREQNERMRREIEAEWRDRREVEAAQREAANRARLMEERRLQMERRAEEQRQIEEAQRRWQAIERLREQEMREEQERQRREEEARARRAAEEAIRRAVEEQARIAREAEERRAEEQARIAREEEERQAQEQQRRAEAEFIELGRTICQTYEAKWTALKTERGLKGIPFHEFPFPGEACNDPSDITLDRVRCFVFWPHRPANEGKSKREILKIEVMRWHPDKFDTLVGPKIAPEDWARVKEAAGLVARWVTTLMAED